MVQSTATGVLPVTAVVRPSASYCSLPAADDAVLPKKHSSFYKISFHSVTLLTS